MDKPEHPLEGSMLQQQIFFSFGGFFSFAETQAATGNPFFQQP